MITQWIRLNSEGEGAIDCLHLHNGHGGGNRSSVLAQLDWCEIVMEAIFRL